MILRSFHTSISTITGKWHLTLGDYYTKLSLHNRMVNLHNMLQKLRVEIRLFKNVQLKYIKRAKFSFHVLIFTPMY